jgi:hypothetical protein
MEPMFEDNLQMNRAKLFFALLDRVRLVLEN